MHRVLPETLTNFRPRIWPGWRAVATFVLRFLCRVTFAIWFGGFTFYAGVVVPDLHENFGGMETGEVSRRVAVVLYLFGGSAILLGGIIAAIDPAERSGWRGKARLGLLAVSSILLVALVAMHRVMGGRLDSGLGRDAFFPLHETYLTVFAIQWLANLGLMAVETGRGPRRD
jgi:hypothetical protein